MVVSKWLDFDMAWPGLARWWLGIKNRDGGKEMAKWW